jgi:HSF-type DNA-binding
MDALIVPRKEEHTYVDYAGVTEEESSDAANSNRLECNPREGQHNFPVKLHFLLNQLDVENLIAWQTHGRSFHVLRPDDFVKTILPLYVRRSRRK